MRFSQCEQNREEMMDSPILPSPRSLFPELFKEYLQHAKIAAPSFKPQILISPLHAGFDKSLNPDLAQKHRTLSLFGCCEVGCNCDANILGGSAKSSPSEAYSGSTSSLSSTPSSPDGFDYLRQHHERKRKSDDYNVEQHDGTLNTKIQKVDSSSGFFGLQRIPDGSFTDTFNDNLTSFRRALPLAVGPSKPMPTTIRKPYQCTFCGKRFARPSSLKTHTYSHTGEKPFVCLEEGCHSQFSVLSNLRRHAKLHASMKGENFDNMKDYS
ncbi:hypothetical protein K7432_000876 [Basidiobolus ranarum]|uniref:C2H2-type domain-containing protein n=1 Tax=Basidiobolus ranarum TaxID=34480 RepID=A0ABR2X3X7_9FUNG